MLKHGKNCLEIEKRAKELIQQAFEMINIYPERDHRMLYHMKEGGEKILYTCNTIRNYHDYVNSLKYMINIITKLQQVAIKCQFNEVIVTLDRIFLLAKNWLNGLISNNISNRFFQLIEIEKLIYDFMNEIKTFTENSDSLITVGEELLKKCREVKTFLIPVTSDSFTSEQFSKIYITRMKEFLNHIYLTQEIIYEETTEKSIREKIQSICMLMHQFDWFLNDNSKFTIETELKSRLRISLKDSKIEEYWRLPERYVAEIEKTTKNLGKTLAPEADPLYFERINKIISSCQEIKSRRFEQINELVRIIFLDIKLMKRWTIKNRDKKLGYRDEDRKNKMNEIIKLIEEIYQPAFKLTKLTEKISEINQDFKPHIEKFN